jgi:hypothetical protein
MEFLGVTWLNNLPCDWPINAVEADQLKNHAIESVKITQTWLIFATQVIMASPWAALAIGCILVLAAVPALSSECCNPYEPLIALKDIMRDAGILHEGASNVSPKITAGRLSSFTNAALFRLMVVWAILVGMGILAETGEGCGPAKVREKNK